MWLASDSQAQAFLCGCEVAGQDRTGRELEQKQLLDVRLEVTRDELSNRQEWDVLALTLSRASSAGVQSPQARCHQPRVLLQLSTRGAHMCRLTPEVMGMANKPDVGWLAPVSRTKDPDRDASR